MKQFTKQFTILADAPESDGFNLMEQFEAEGYDGDETPFELTIHNPDADVPVYLTLNNSATVKPDDFTTDGAPIQKGNPSAVWNYKHETNYQNGLDMRRAWLSSETNVTVKITLIGRGNQ